VTFSPDGKLALVPNLGTWDVTVIDVAEQKVIGSVEVGSSPVGVVVMPDSKKAYVAVYGENVVAVIDLQDLKVVKRITTGIAPDGIAIARSPEGLKL
jgi:YVTN family beta-propeller protein